MEQVEIFSGESKTVKKEVNKFFQRKGDKIKVTSRLLSTTGEDNNSATALTTIAIFYTEKQMKAKKKH